MINLKILKDQYKELENLHCVQIQNIVNALKDIVINQVDEVVHNEYLNLNSAKATVALNFNVPKELKELCNVKNNLSDSLDELKQTIQRLEHLSDQIVKLEKYYPCEI